MIRLTAQLDHALPEGLTALADVEVVVAAASPPTVRVPDVVVVPADVAERNRPRIDAADVLLAVEIISPGTRRTDRVMKPTEYADAGIPGYWLIDLDPPADLTAHTLVDGDHEVVGAGTGPITLLHPVEIRIDLGRLLARRQAG